ncbi:MAG: hypothetical protein GXO43_09115 [Crenarchaeota archaeon]|nr:hypothetical protein [Thermoproteota archaeon]
MSSALVKEYMCTGSMFSFARCYSDRLYAWIAHGRERRKTTTEYHVQHIPRMRLNHLTELLRLHEKEPYMPWKGSNYDICMHYDRLIRPS